MSSPTTESSLRLRALLNPSARSGRARGAARRLALAGASWEESESAAHLQELIRAAQDPAAEPHEVLLLAGGDGTVRLAAEALRGVEQRVPLAPIPLGSGNDFARDLGIAGPLATPAALLAAGAPRAVDVAQLEDAAGAALARYTCVASLGFDARALELIHGSWLPRSRFLNVVSSLRAIWSVPAAPLRIRWEGGGYEGPAMLAAVTNTRGYGGGFLLSPNASLSDGLLDLCVIGDIGRARLLGEFPKIFAGTHGERPGVTLAQSPWFSFEPLEGPLPLCLDGERPEHEAAPGAPLTLRCLPGALQVWAPPAAGGVA